MTTRDSTPNGLSRRNVLQAGLGLAGGAMLPAGLTLPAFAADHPPLGTWPAGTKGNSVFVGVTSPLTGAYSADGKDHALGYELAPAPAGFATWNDFYRELGDLFGVPLAPHNRWAVAKALRERWQGHIDAALFRPVVVVDEAQEMQAAGLNELALLGSARLDPPTG